MKIRASMKEKHLLLTIHTIKPAFLNGGLNGNKISSKKELMFE